MRKVKSKRFYVCILLLVIFAVLLTLFCFVHRINQKYPQAVTTEYKIQEPIVYKGLEYTVTDFSLINWSDMATEFPSVDFTLDPVENGEIQRAEDMYILLWSLDITNLSESEKKCYIYDLVGITTTWHNGLDLNLFYDLNDREGAQSSVTPTLQEKETISIIVPIPITKGQISEEDWETVESLNFQLLFALYPEKIVFLSDSYYNDIKIVDGI